MEKCWTWGKEISICPCRTLFFHWICIQLIMPFLHLSYASVQFSRRTIFVWHWGTGLKSEKLVLVILVAECTKAYNGFLWLPHSLRIQVVLHIGLAGRKVHRVQGDRHAGCKHATFQTSSVFCSGFILMLQVSPVALGIRKLARATAPSRPLQKILSKCCPWSTWLLSTTEHTGQ